MIKKSIVEHPERADLSAYADGELEGFAAQTVEQHLAMCPACRKEVEGFTVLDHRLGALTSREPRFRTAMSIVGAASGQRRPRRKSLIAAGIAAGVVALAGLWGMGLQPAVSMTSLQSIRPFSVLKGRPVPGGDQSGSAQLSLGQSQSINAVPSAVPMAGLSTGGSHDQSAQTGTGQSPSMPAHAPAQATESRGVPQPTVVAGTAVGRLIERSGSLELRVNSVPNMFNTAGDLARRVGGYVSDSSNMQGGQEQGAMMTLRVPAARFDDMLRSLMGVRGVKVVDERIWSNDITDSYHDLQAQAQALRTTRDQLLSLMHQANGVQDAMSVLDRLTDVNAQIDSVEGQLQASSNSIMLSTITVQLLPQPGKHVIVPPRKPAGWDPGATVRHAVGNVIHALQGIATVGIYTVIYLTLPVLLVLLGMGVWRRRGAVRIGHV